MEVVERQQLDVDGRPVRRVLVAGRGGRGWPGTDECDGDGGRGDDRASRQSCHGCLSVCTGPSPSWRAILPGGVHASSWTRSAEIYCTGSPARQGRIRYIGTGEAWPIPCDGHRPGSAGRGIPRRPRWRAPARTADRARRRPAVDAARRAAGEARRERDAHLVDQTGVQQRSEQVRPALAEHLRPPALPRRRRAWREDRPRSSPHIDHVGDRLERRRRAAGAAACVMTTGRTARLGEDGIARMRAAARRSRPRRRGCGEQARGLLAPPAVVARSTATPP